jgi:hypothetical protein
MVELEAVVVALNAQDSQQLEGEQSPADWEGEDDQGYGGQPASRLEGLGRLGSFGGGAAQQRDNNGLLQLCKQTQHLLGSTLEHRQHEEVAPVVPVSSDNEPKSAQPPLEGAGLLTAMRRLEGLTDAVLTLHERQSPVAMLELSDDEAAERKRVWKQARRCLQAWRPLLRVLRLRVEGLSTTTIPFLVA